MLNANEVYKEAKHMNKLGIVFKHQNLKKFLYSNAGSLKFIDSQF